MLCLWFPYDSNAKVVAGALLGYLPVSFSLCSSARATARSIYIVPPTCSKANRYLSTERTTLLLHVQFCTQQETRGTVYLSVTAA